MCSHKKKLIIAWIYQAEKWYSSKHPQRFKIIVSRCDNSKKSVRKEVVLSRNDKKLMEAWMWFGKGQSVFVTSLTTNDLAQNLDGEKRRKGGNGDGEHVALRLPVGQCHTDQSNCPMELVLCSPSSLSTAFTNFPAHSTHRVLLVSTIIRKPSAKKNQ